MFKKILVIGLGVVILAAVGVSAYNVFAGSAARGAVGAESVAQLGDPQAGATNVGRGAQAGANGYRPAAQPGAAAQSSSWQNNGVGQGGGQGNRYGQGGRGRGQSQGQGAGAQTGVPNPQAAANEIVILHGVVSNFAAPNFTLTTDDGQSVAVQLGNPRFSSELGVSLQDGDVVTLTGFYETAGSFAASTITLDATGQTYVLRDAINGRPMWAGGPKNH
jgi:hypothetical protein